MPSPGPAAPATRSTRRRTRRGRTAILDTESYRLAFEDSAIGMAIEDIDGHYLQVNPELCSMVGYSAAQLLTMRYQDVCHPDDLETPEYLEALQDGSERSLVRECRYLRADGTQLWVRVHVGVIEVDGAAEFYIAQIEDITAQKDAEERLIFQARHDALTDLPNRDALAERMAAAMDAGHRPALLFIDLDRFKLVNDSLGHAAGDRVLISAADRLRGAVRDDDVVARIGGDEFVVLALSAPTRAGAAQLAERLHSEMSRPFELDGRSLILSVSIGVAFAGGDVTSAEDLLRAADLAMYQGKTSGRSRTVVYDASMREQAERRLALEQDLRVLTDSPEQLQVWFQPVISLATATMVMAEALVRWAHPRLGLLSPAEFLPVAEEAGLLEPIADVVMRRALGQARRWRQLGVDLRASVNLAAPQLGAPAFDTRLAQQIADAGLEPHDLCIEVAETVLVDAGSAAARTVNSLRRLGVGVAVDDFGTGYSSLAYLRQSPVDLIKLDRAFVEALEANPRDAAIVGAVIQLSHALGVACIAEGVERPGQLQQLTRLGCDQVQGYLLFKPCPADDFAHHLRSAGTHVRLLALASR